jgi:hypothetical protein
MKYKEGVYLVVYVCLAISLLIMLHYAKTREHYENPLQQILSEKAPKPPPEKETSEVKMVVTKDKPAPKDVGTRLTKLEEDIKLLQETSDGLKDHQDKQDKKVQDAEDTIAESASTLDTVNST